MPIERDELRRVMGHFATGVTIITTHDGDQRHYGLTANAVCSLSLTPPRILVCVDKRAESHGVFERSRSFVVNVLTRAQESLSRRFAVSGGDKFTEVPYRTGRTGCAILEGALAHIECRLVEVLEGGDHTIYVGEVESAHADEGEPLLFFRGQYAQLRRD
jgi:flavin reductase (DIM6/NTAB) family NADH-FMN oxidoreductase RutF